MRRRGPSLKANSQACLVAASLCAGLVACDAGPGAGASQILVDVEPKLAEVATGASTTFAATVTGTANLAVTWAVTALDGSPVDSSIGGTLDGTGKYLAPASVGTFAVVATSVADPTKKGTAVVDVAVPSSTDPIGLLPPERRTTWNPGLNAVGGIPHRTTIYRTLTPSGGDDTSAIQSALNGCPPNQVVQLGNGTFRISGQGLVMDRSNVTLRGNGPANTKLVKTSGTSYPVLIFGERWYSWLQPASFASDGAKGTSSVTFASNPGVTVGEIVHVNETYDAALTWYSPTRQTSDYLGWGEGRKGAKAASRPIGQAMEVASVQANVPSSGMYTVTFTTPFHVSFRTARGAHLVRLGNSWPGEVVPATKWSGVEDLYVSNGEGGDGGGNIRMFASAYCWARNIESDRSKGASFAFDGCFRCELRDSYLHSTVNPNPGGEGYGIVIDTYTADSLVENNISWNFNKVMAMRSSGGGNVIAYNYMEDGYGAGYASIAEVGLNASHMTTPHMELFEGNQSFNFDSDSVWGNSIYITVFRNHLTGKRRSVPPVTVTDTSNRRAIGLTIYHWWYSFLGNVLGYEGMTPSPGYSSFRYEWPGSGAPMWQLGYDGETWNRSDPQTTGTVIRHGNFDYVTNGVVWDPAIARRELPPSLYLGSKPAFFGANPWPWVTPEGAGSKVATLPARARFDALH